MRPTLTPAVYDRACPDVFLLVVLVFHKILREMLKPDFLTDSILTQIFLPAIGFCFHW